jgi:hypothetical protein
MTDPVGRYVIFSTETGRHSRIVSCRASQIQSQCRPGEAFRVAGLGLTTDRHKQDLTTGETVALEVAPEDPMPVERATRDRLLALSDWTQAPDNRLTAEQKAAWAAVREDWRGRIDDIKAGLPARPWAAEPS